MRKSIIAATIIACLATTLVPAAALAHPQCNGPIPQPMPQYYPPIQVTVTETYQEAVADFSWVWDWSCWSFVRVQVGTHFETRTVTRTVTATWDSARNCYTY